MFLIDQLNLIQFNNMDMYRFLIECMPNLSHFVCFFFLLFPWMRITQHWHTNFLRIYEKFCVFIPSSFFCLCYWQTATERVKENNNNKMINKGKYVASYLNVLFLLFIIHEVNTNTYVCALNLVLIRRIVFFVSCLNAKKAVFFIFLNCKSFKIIILSFVWKMFTILFQYQVEFRCDLIEKKNDRFEPKLSIPSNSRPKKTP